MSKKTLIVVGTIIVILVIILSYTIIIQINQRIKTKLEISYEFNVYISSNSSKEYTIYLPIVKSEEITNDIHTVIKEKTEGGWTTHSVKLPFQKINGDHGAAIKVNWTGDLNFSSFYRSTEKLDYNYTSNWIYAKGIGNNAINILITTGYWTRYDNYHSHFTGNAIGGMKLNDTYYVGNSPYTKGVRLIENWNQYAISNWSYGLTLQT